MENGQKRTFLWDISISHGEISAIKGPAVIADHTSRYAAAERPDQVSGQMEI